MPHPDEEIVFEYRAQMNILATALDGILNPEEKKLCFVLLISPFDTEDSRCNYISNGDRRDIVLLLKEMVARFEGQPEMKGSA